MIILKSIRKYDSLVTQAKVATRNQKIQRDVDHLTKELDKGNFQAGLGRKKLFGDIFYLRGRNGGRLFYRRIGEDTYEIIAIASKVNEETVINLIERYFK
ncbi:hypothetical protein CL616_01085 [archaeon]|nr:hypothetical protein [archaeon]|tara:strand:- start:82 stop:381 length:300 start_codon:yes stop_codon:yes gene_type:complete